MALFDLIILVILGVYNDVCLRIVIVCFHL